MFLLLFQLRLALAAAADRSSCRGLIVSRSSEVSESLLSSSACWSLGGVVLGIGTGKQLSQQQYLESRVEKRLDCWRRCQLVALGEVGLTKCGLIYRFVPRCRETIRPRQLDPSAAAAQVLAETTTSPSFLTADRLVTTVHGQYWYTVRNRHTSINGPVYSRQWEVRNALGEPLILQDFQQCPVWISSS